MYFACILDSKHIYLVRSAQAWPTSTMPKSEGTSFWVPSHKDKYYVYTKTLKIRYIYIYTSSSEYKGCIYIYIRSKPICKPCINHTYTRRKPYMNHIETIYQPYINHISSIYIYTHRIYTMYKPFINLGIHHLAAAMVQGTFRVNCDSAPWIEKFLRAASEKRGSHDTNILYLYNVWVIY